jgi:hypothetical protein
MVTPLTHPGADSSLLERFPPTVTTKGGPWDLPPPIITKCSLWEFNFHLLLQFRDREGHLRVPRSHDEDGRKLGCWIQRNRARERRGTLPLDEKRRLNEIGFIWNSQIGRSDTMVRALIQFKEREGMCHIPDKHMEYLDGTKINLGLWLKGQRYQQGCGKMDPKREKRLESLGVKWSQNHKEISDEHFDRNFDLLLRFQEQEGHVRVPIKHQENLFGNLGFWLAKQRSLHRRRLLELDRQKWLEVAGVTWETWPS